MPSRGMARRAVTARRRMLIVGIGSFLGVCFTPLAPLETDGRIVGEWVGSWLEKLGPVPGRDNIWLVIRTLAGWSRPGQNPPHPFSPLLSCAISRPGKMGRAD